MIYLPAVGVTLASSRSTRVSTCLISHSLLRRADFARSLSLVCLVGHFALVCISSRPLKAASHSPSAIFVAVCLRLRPRLACLRLPPRQPLPASTVDFISPPLALNSPAFHSSDCLPQLGANLFCLHCAVHYAIGNDLPTVRSTCLAAVPQSILWLARALARRSFASLALAT